MSVPLTTAQAASTVWQVICRYDDLPTERGVCALVGGEQVALFRTQDGAVYALSNRDPHSGAQVMSRGIVGTRGEVPTVTSPLYKHPFDLSTGRCLDDGGVRVRRYPVRVHAGLVEVSAGPETDVP